MMKRCKHSRSTSSFTLIELLAVMGIMMLMASIAVMSYFGATRGAAARSAVSHLRNSLSFARQTAIMNRRSAYVIFEEGTNFYSYVTCLHHGSGSGSGRILSPGEDSDWSGLVAGGAVYNLDEGLGSIIIEVSDTYVKTTNSIWGGGGGGSDVKYGWPVQETIFLPQNFVVAESGEEALPETVVFGSDGTVRASGHDIEVFESIAGIKEPAKIEVTVEGLTGFTSVSWPDD